MAEFEQKRIVAEFEYKRAMAPWTQVGRALDILRRVLTIASYAIPLHQVVRIVEAAAGQDTTFDFNMQIGIAIAAAEAIGLGAQQQVIRRQQVSLAETRERIDLLEGRLRDNGFPVPGVSS